MQIAYHPAIVLHHRTPLDSPLPPTVTLEVESDEPTLAKRLASLRDRVRSAYLDQLRLKVAAVLQHCLRWKVRVVVFPEYSIPWQLLEDVSKWAGDMVVVAGTHYVDRAARESGIYDRLGLKPPPLRCAVAPVLQAGKLLALQPKFNPSREEEGEITPGTTWEPIDLPGLNLPGPMGVLICLDFLYRENPRHHELIGPGLEKCIFLAVPSLTSKGSLAEFGAKSKEEALRYHRPVVYANTAEANEKGGGGSTIIVDQGSRPTAARYPDTVEVLPAGEEGVVVADVQLSFERSGESTPYDWTRQVRPVAAASLVYRNHPAADRYAETLERLERLLRRDDDEALSELSAELDKAADDLAAISTLGGPSTRRRLAKLRDSHRQLDSIEDFRQLLREVILPREALPLHLVESALSGGAEEAILAWQQEYLEAPLPELARQLHPAATAVRDPDAISWTSEAREAASSIWRRVRGDSHTVDAKRLDAYRGLTVTTLSVDDEEIAGLLNKGDYSGALARAKRNLDQARALANQDQHARALVEQVTLRRLRVVQCYLGLLENENARRELNDIDESFIPKSSIAEFVTWKAQLGDIADARRVYRQNIPFPHQESAGAALLLFEGVVPELPPERPALRLLAAHVLLEQGLAGKAAEWAIAALEKERRYENRISGLGMLLAALQHSILELKGTLQAIPIEQRSVVIERISHLVREMKSSTDPLPPHARKEVDRIADVFAELVHDPSVNHPEPPEVALAREGEVEKAVQQATGPYPTHPWFAEFWRCQLLWAAERREEAIERLRILATEFPRREPIAFALAQMLSLLRRYKEALAHALVAWELLPGPGARSLLATCYIQNSEPDRGWDLLKDVRDVRDASTLKARAWAAQNVSPGDALSAWKAYLEVATDDWESHVRYAALLSHMGHHADAEQYARGLLDGAAVDAITNPAALYELARLQRLSGQDRAEPNKYAARVIDILRDRFPGNAQAEALRLNLVLQLGLAPESAQIDYQRLTEAGFLRAAPLDEVLKEIAADRESWKALWDLYQKGLMSVEELCLRANSPVELLQRVVDLDSGGLSTPTRFFQPPIGAMAGIHILAGHLDLLLLQHVGLEDQLRHAIGPEGRFLVFDDVLQNIISDAQRTAEQFNFTVLESTAGLVEALQKAMLDSRLELSTDSEADLAKRRNAALVVDGNASFSPDVKTVDGHAFVHNLETRGLIDHPTGEAIKKLLRPSTSPEQTPAEPIVLTLPVLEAFYQAGAIDTLTEVTRGRGILAKETWQALLYKKGALERQRSVMTRARKLQEWIGHGLEGKWVQRLPRPALSPELPPIRAEHQETGVTIYRELLTRALSWKEALVGHPERRLLTTDFLVASLFDQSSPSAVLLTLAWTPSTYIAAVERYRALCEQVITLEDIVGALADGPQRTRILTELARLGCQDAVNKDVILSVVLRFGDLEGERPSQFLSSIERVARERLHPGCAVERARIAQLYADVIWSAWTHPQEPKLASSAAAISPMQASVLTSTLLGRAEALDLVPGHSVLERTLLFICALGVGAVRHSFVPAGGINVAIAAESLTGRLWKAIHDWVGTDGLRRSALGRAIRSVLLTLDENAPPEGPSLTAVAPVMLWYRTAKMDAHREIKKPKTPDLTEPALGAMAILSAQWQERPLEQDGLVFELPSGKSTTVSYERALELAAKAVGEAPGRAHGNAFALWVTITIPELEVEADIVVPPEALLLRAPAPKVPQLAYDLARVCGRSDQRLFRALVQLMEHPSELDARRAVARASLESPRRPVRDDPSVIQRWGESLSGYPRDLDELRELLSEPPGPLPEGPIDEVVFKRVVDGGLWRDRLDVHELGLIATEIPGEMCVQILPWRLAEDDDFEERVAGAIQRLKLPDEQPAPRLEADLVFLRVVAEQHPQVEIEGKAVDLRELLPNIIADLLRTVLEDPPPDSLAAVEAGMLRLCADVITRMSQYQGLSLREGLWLTWRLYGWVAAQLETLQPDARRQAFNRLTRIAPPATTYQPGAPLELLHPARFSRNRFDHRLASVLYGVMVGEQAVWQLTDRTDRTARKPEPHGATRWVSSPAVIRLLAEIAARTWDAEDLEIRKKGDEPTVLPWHGPGAIQDIAMLALLRLDSTEFKNVVPEIRSRFLSALPRSIDDPDSLGMMLASQLLLAASDSVEALSPAERETLKVRAKVSPKNPKFVVAHSVALARLYGLGATELESEVLDRVNNSLRDPNAPLLFGDYLVALSRVAAQRIAAEFNRVVDLVAKEQLDPVPFSLGLARLAFLGTTAGKEVARELVLKITTTPPYASDERVQQLATLLGITTSPPGP